VPARVGSRRGAIAGWVWAVPKRAPNPELGYQLARHLTSKAVAEREAAAFLIQTGRTDVPPPNIPLAQVIMPPLEAQMKLDGGHRLPTVTSRKELDDMVGKLVGAWWSIVVERRFLDQQRVDRGKIARELEAAL
jgi:hypothetical protein